MSEEVNMILDETKSQMKKAINHLESELAKIRAGKAQPSMLDGVVVDYYGTKQPLKNISNINTPDAKSIIVQPFEKGTLEDIEKAIQQANLGFNPMNDGNIIRINIPPLTEERRTSIVKQAKSETENCKITIRNARKEANDYIKGLVKEGLSEDLGKDAEEQVQQLTNKYTELADKHLEAKEKEIMTI